MRRGAREIGAPITASRQHRLVRPEQMQAAVIQVPGQATNAGAVFVHNQVEGDVLHEELGLVAQRLLIQRVQDRVTRPVRCRTSAQRGAFAKIRGHAAKSALIDMAAVCARERHAVVF